MLKSKISSLRTVAKGIAASEAYLHQEQEKPEENKVIEEPKPESTEAAKEDAPVTKCIWIDPNIHNE